MADIDTQQLAAALAQALQQGGNNQPMLSAIQNANQILSKMVQAFTTSLPQIQSTQTTVGAAGGASALPATPLGYINMTLPNGTAVVVPYFNP